LIRAEQLHGAGVALDEAEQDAHQRGLAGAIRTEQSEQLSRSRDKVYAAEDFTDSVEL
jgi:hypothetical protein